MVFPDETMNEGVPLKLGNSSTVVRCVIENQPYIVKRYNIKSWTHRVRRWIKRRARNAWQNGHWLDFVGIDTAKPVALLEQRWGWFAGVSYLVMPDVGERDLAHTLAIQPGRFDDLAPQTVSLLRKLKVAGLQHGDLKATNFMVSENRVLLIDYDALSEGSFESDRARFVKNWVEDNALSEAWQKLMVEADI